RIDDVPEPKFFTPAELATLEAFADIVLHQPSEPRIPVLRFVDEKHADGRLEGYQYAGMPDDGEAWRLVARGLDEAARGPGAATFAEAPGDLQLELVEAFANGSLDGGAWNRLDADRAWGLVLRDLLAAFYAHPWAWNEIGFGGPAFPRGYARLGVGLTEEW